MNNITQPRLMVYGSTLIFKPVGVWLGWKGAKNEQNP